MSVDIPLPGTPVRGSATGRPIMAMFDLLGRTWAMGVVWQLGKGPASFRELQTRCDEMSPTVLNRRLKELRAAGLVAMSDSGYDLSNFGREVLDVLGRMDTVAQTWEDHIPSAGET